jgi:hypothetical protein
MNARNCGFVAITRIMNEVSSVLNLKPTPLMPKCYKCCAIPSPYNFALSYKILFTYRKNCVMYIIFPQPNKLLNYIKSLDKSHFLRTRYKCCLITIFSRTFKIGGYLSYIITLFNTLLFYA